MPYDVMQVCENGHKITTVARANPESQKKFCPKCGAATYMGCPECDAEVPGLYSSDSKNVIIVPSSPEVPRHCENCGAAYPWAKHISELK